MFEIAAQLLEAIAASGRIAVATVVAVDGSAPRTVGTSMAFDGSAVIASIAGGCVEGAVVETCSLVLADGVARTAEYGFDSVSAFSVGLSCGGRLRVQVERVGSGHPVVEEWKNAAAGVEASRFSVLSGDPDGRETRLAAELEAHRSRGVSGTTLLNCDDEPLEVFFEVFAVPPRLIIFGAMDYSAALSLAAQALGYRVTVCDPRALFATPARFPGAELVVAWPASYLPQAETDSRTVICVLSHDARFDNDVLEQALALPVAFVGAMGSRRTHEERVAVLRVRGVSDEAISRMHSPIGLDIGASSPAETAVAILAEIVVARTGASAKPLTHTTGPVHRPAHRPFDPAATQQTYGRITT
ncbi:MAG: XdhC family protein [Microbacteriaceae bacterium]|nr:XdhC family protein [Microbacteriaceae bacterium]